MVLWILFDFFFFFFNDTATTEIYTLSLHDALPISSTCSQSSSSRTRSRRTTRGSIRARRSEEHTSELSHEWISYAVFCLKKKKKKNPARTKHKKTRQHHIPRTESKKT